MSTHVRPGEAAAGALRKRKDREPSDSPRARSPAGPDPVQPALARDNRLLAGCLAHEFLTKGTLFGKRWEPNGSEPDNNMANVVRPGSADGDTDKERANPVRSGSTTAEPARSKPPIAYAEVSYLLKADGARIPGVVNPTQLARWLQM
ncbi:uncharacterized protein LOC103975776 [Musa acuminata AAA Group]|uniref:uncharacterized protein LOC103975776 n=1 Tax=Musa acuminata AAA Group TaxID=214697 RepID=UPI0031E3206E